MKQKQKNKNNSQRKSYLLLLQILTISIIIISTFGVFGNKVQASTYLINEANLYSKGEIDGFAYKGVNVGVQFVVYKKDGVEYPAYCLNRNLPGVTEEHKYLVSINKVVENAAVWRAITNGYPFKTASQLGCNSNIEAFAATKMAVYDALYTYKWSDFTAQNKQGERIIRAAEKISINARKSNESKPVAKVTVKSIDEEWKIDNVNNNYVSKTYKVETNVKSSQYTVKIIGDKTNEILITNNENKEQQKFNSNQTFKVLLPFDRLDEDGKIEIQVTSDMETKPILYGKSADSSYQDYALAAGNIEYENGKITDKYYKNKTRIELIKKDTETGEVVKGAKFNILNDKKEIIYSDIMTNDEGKAQIDNIKPGIYYIEEIKAPDGYTRYEELIEIEIVLNQTYTVYVENYKKPEEEEKDVETKRTTVVGQKEIKLPRTGF